MTMKKQILVLLVLVAIIEPLLIAGSSDALGPVPDPKFYDEKRFKVTVLDAELSSGKIIITKWKYDPWTGERPTLPYREIYWAKDGTIQLERTVKGTLVNGTPTFK